MFRHSTAHPFAKLSPESSAWECGGAAGRRIKKLSRFHLFYPKIAISSGAQKKKKGKPAQSAPSLDPGCWIDVPDWNDVPRAARKTSALFPEHSTGRTRVGLEPVGNTHASTVTVGGLLALHYSSRGKTDRAFGTWHTHTQKPPDIIFSICANWKIIINCNEYFQHMIPMKF